MNIERTITPSEAEQRELIAKFRASLVLSSDSQACEYLAFCNWNLEEALATHAADHRE